MYKPGDIVLSKLGSFPPWPAMVFPEDCVPKDVLKLKPKKGKTWPVCYFAESTFNWDTERTLTPLTREQCDSFLSKPANKKAAKRLVQAYSIALDTPSLDDMLEQLNFKRKSSTPQPRRSYTNAEKESLAKSYRAKLQKGLVIRDTQPTQEEMQHCSSVLAHLEDFQQNIGMSLDLLRSSKLHKVLKAIVKIPRLERPDDFQFHKRCAKLLVEWQDMITVIKSEKLDRKD